MDRYLKEVGDRIRQARLKKGINQAQLAEIIDKTPPYVSNIEMGKQNMSIIVLYKIVKALDVSADWITVFLFYTALEVYTRFGMVSIRMIF